MGFKDEAREAFANLVTRVEALESLAEQIKGSPISTPARREGVAAQRSTLDYGAVAFGLSEIKRKVSHLAESAGHTSGLRSEYADTVQYFADVFAKADPAFDAAAFKRQAGV